MRVVTRPRLFELLDRGACGRVTLVCAPAGSGKTMLVSSWLRDALLPGPVAWVDVARDEADTTRFWGLVMDAMRGAVAAGDPLATLVPAPLGGQDELVARMVEGLGRQPQPLLLVLDDLHQLRSDEALAGLENLLARAPAQLRILILSRRDPPLALHRLRVAGELVEIRGGDLDFTAGEAAELLDTAGVAIAGADVARLHERTEGWAAGLRLAAMSLARHAEPDRFVAEFSGSERTVADYLLAEVLASQPPEVRRLLLRTCILERVCGPLADRLTGAGDGARLLHQLEEANAFVVAVDVARSWFRYHHLLADLLALELRREAPGEVAGLHRLAAGWHAEHGDPLAAIRHALAGEDFELAGELLGREWVALVLDGEEATLGSLLSGFPERLIEADAELAAVSAADQLAGSRWAEADALLAAAGRALPGVPADRARRARTALAAVQLLRARRLGDAEAVVDEASAVLSGDCGVGAELEALAAMNLGIAESWTLRPADAEANLERGLALGRQIGRPFVEVACLGALGVVANMTGRLNLAEGRLRQAIAVADRVGWSTLPTIAIAHMTLAAVLIDRGRLAEAEGWLARAAPVLADAPEPAGRLGLRHAQGMLALARGRFAEAVEAFRAGEQAAGELRATHFLATAERQWQLRSRLLGGDAAPATAALAGATGGAEWCNLAARLSLGAGDAAAAAAAVAPVLAGTAPAYHVNLSIEALLLDGIARSQLGEAEAAQRSVERMLALTEPEGRVWIVLTVPGANGLLARHPVHRTAHAGFLKELIDHLEGVEPDSTRPDGLPEALSERELSVLRFLPTNLSAAEIGSELFVSVHTVKTHMRKLYAKLDVHTRTEAVQRGRALGLLAPPRRAG